MRVSLGNILPHFMAHLRRLLAYGVCVAIATPPVAYGQTAAPTSAQATTSPAGMSGVVLSASQSQTYARLMIKWPAGANLEATAAINSGIALIRLPRPTQVDPTVFTRSAPQFIAGAALSADKRTIRLALVQAARVVASRAGNTQVFDLIQPDAANPPPLGSAPELSGVAENTAAAGTQARAPGEPLPKMINAAAPVGAPVFAAPSQDRPQHHC